MKLTEFGFFALAPLLRLSGRGRPVLLLLAGLLLSGGCTITKDLSAVSTLTARDGAVKTVLMPIDVKLYVLTVGGTLEPRSDWTQAAKQHILTAVEKEQWLRGSQLQIYREPEDDDPVSRRLVELERLHGAVGSAIVRHNYSDPPMPLPTKRGALDWTLGPEVRAIRETYDADYALFIHLRDSYSSGGRKLATLAALMVGLPLLGGQQAGFASLVDLNTGNVVWFNHLLSTGGDLRTEEPAAKTVRHLLKGLPG